MTDLRIELLTGDRLAAAVDRLADLRIEVFRDFPYLYEGSAAYERSYLRTYLEAADSVVVGCRHGDELVGASTGLPLVDEADYVTRPFERAGIAPEPVFYFGESILRAAWRGRGVGVAFFAEREAHARRLGRFTHAAFCAVVRPPDHPMRPPGHVPLDGFWRRRGYAPVPGLVATFEWPDLGDGGAETAKPMQFWMKRLDAGT